MEIFPGISMDPGIRFGKPCVMGTRIDVATVLGGLASGAASSSSSPNTSSRASRSSRLCVTLPTSRSTCPRPWEAPMKILLDENFPLALVGGG